MPQDETTSWAQTLANCRAFAQQYPTVKYKIVRFFQNGSKRTITTGLTLEQAQAHCKDPETSSRTCTKAAGRRRTRQNGPWFEGYTEEK